MSAPDDPAGPAEDRLPAGDGGVRYGRRRRAPRYGSFVATGAIVGVLLGAGLSLVQSSGNQANGQFSVNTVLGYVAAILGLLGALLGAGLAVVLDRRRGRTPAAPSGQEAGGGPAPR